MEFKRKFAVGPQAMVLMGMAAAFVAACGGGGGGGGGNSTATTNTSISVVPTLALFAGNTNGRGTLDGTGMAAHFYAPSDAAADSAGNIYVADTGNNTIRKITPAGVVTTIAGIAGLAGSANGTGTAATFKMPQGIAVDSAGNIYVSDSGNYTIRKITPAGVVSTLAGTAGVPGTLDGTGSAASFMYPTGMAVDSAGNLYVADSNGHTIRKITLAGVVTTFAGTAGVAGKVDGTGTAASFNGPQDVAIDSVGNLYVADTFNYTIRKITPAAVVSTLAGTGTAGSLDGTGAGASFNWPRGIGIDSSGNIYVADTANNTIRKVTSAGVVTTVAGVASIVGGNIDGIGTAARFYMPWGIAVDSTGNLYVAENYNQGIRKITPAAVVSTFAGSSLVYGGADGVGSTATFNSPWGMTTDSTGNLYVADNLNHTIRKISPAGNVTTLAGSSGFFGAVDGTGSAARFYNPMGVAADSANNIYVADCTNNTIRKITSAGVVTTFAGTAGVMGGVDGTGASASFYSPVDVASDSAGNLYVADFNNNAIRKITPAGVVTTLAGTAGVTGGYADGTGPAAKFNHPYGVATDATGNVYVADSMNNVIRKITPAGVVTTLAGTAGAYGSADGAGAAARFNWPVKLTTDSAGNLYVAENVNSSVRMITPSGVVTTLVGQPGQFGFTPGNQPGILGVTRGIAMYGNLLYIATENGIAKVSTQTTTAVVATWPTKSNAEKTAFLSPALGAR